MLKVRSAENWLVGWLDQAGCQVLQPVWGWVFLFEQDWDLEWAGVVWWVSVVFLAWDCLRELECERRREQDWVPVLEQG
jgi:hypothetical protein